LWLNSYNALKNPCLVQRLKAFEKAIKQAKNILAYAIEKNIDNEQISILKEILSDNVTMMAKKTRYQINQNIS
jgi:hypothetical protein